MDASNPDRFECWFCSGRCRVSMLFTRGIFSMSSSCSIHEVSCRSIGTAERCCALEGIQNELAQEKRRDLRPPEPVHEWLCEPPTPLQSQLLPQHLLLPDMPYHSLRDTQNPRRHLANFDCNYLRRHVSLHSPLCSVNVSLHIETKYTNRGP